MNSFENARVLIVVARGRKSWAAISAAMPDDESRSLRLRLRENVRVDAQVQVLTFYLDGGLLVAAGRGHDERLPARALLSGAPRNAISPANALLNLAYAVIETETRIALLANGLDPEMGLMHSTRRYRSALAHDVMEPLRPLADRWVLELLERRVFAAHDFVETRQGVCRLVPLLPQALAGMAPAWLERAEPLARWLVSTLDAVSGAKPGRPVALKPLPAPTPLEQGLSLMPRCRTCGTELPEYRRKNCASCAVGLRNASMPAVARAGQAALARLRAEGRDPGHAGAARRQRSAAVARRHAEARAWHRTRTQIADDRETFRGQVFTRVQNLPVAELARLTGLSKAQCSLVRRGLRVLHPRHWAAVLALLPA